MSHVLVITFEDETQAPSVLSSLRSLDNQSVLNLEDAAIIIKDATGKVEIKNLTGTGATSGALAGGLIGLAVGGILFPLAALAIGAVGGAVVGKSLKTGLDAKFISEVEASLTPCSSAILFIVNRESVGVLIAALEQYKGKIYQSSFDSEAEEQIRKALM